jgi:hypothetical protein
MRAPSSILAAAITASLLCLTACNKDSSAAERRPTDPTINDPAAPADSWRSLRDQSSTVLTSVEKEIEDLKARATDATRPTFDALSLRLSAARNRAEELTRQGGAAADDAWKTLQQEIEALRADARRAANGR